MKIRVLGLLLFTILCMGHSFAQLTRFCDPLPKPNPRAPEPTFQLPFGLGDGFKFYGDRPDPYFAYINILPTYVVWKRTLKVGVGPEMIWSDLTPRPGVKLNASFDIKDFDISSLNNIPIGSMLFSVWGNWGSQAPAFGAHISFEINWFFAGGIGTAYFADNGCASLTKNLTFNPFFYEGKEENISPAPAVNENMEDKYYKTFMTRARSILQSNRTILDLVRSSINDQRWNKIENIEALQNIMDIIAPVTGGPMITQIISEARNANVRDHLTASEDKQRIVQSILEGFCKVIK